MGKIIQFPYGADREIGEQVITATNYFLCRADNNGNEIFREAFDGTEYINTTCAECGVEFWLDIYEFCEIVASGFDFYGTSLFCGECSKKRVNRG